MVMGGDSRTKGRGFESWHCILDGHDIFSHSFVVKIVCLKRQKKRPDFRVPVCPEALVTP